ncbi:uncharacterized protein LOC108841083 [Raphanus sativus]|uniref:Uncharacterized protein LOC108841083 n=1 Tax=Raphanus sativus TaxID=3726 RepID=A0A9W3CAU4_RAPSA|nr:uncharacterized protein LOC108841083 [Raphanus sativus]
MKLLSLFAILLLLNLFVSTNSFRLDCCRCGKWVKHTGLLARVWTMYTMQARYGQLQVLRLRVRGLSCRLQVLVQRQILSRAFYSLTPSSRYIIRLRDPKVKTSEHKAYQDEVLRSCTKST